PLGAPLARVVGPAGRPGAASGAAGRAAPGGAVRSGGAGARSVGLRLRAAPGRGGPAGLGGHVGAAAQWVRLGGAVGPPGGGRTGDGRLRLTTGPAPQAPRPGSSSRVVGQKARFGTGGCR